MRSDYVIIVLIIKITINQHIIIMIIYNCYESTSYKNIEYDVL